MFPLLYVILMLSECVSVILKFGRILCFMGTRNSERRSSPPVKLDTGIVTGIVMSFDGTRLAYVSTDRIRLLDVKSGKYVCTPLPMIGFLIRDIVMSADRTRPAYAPINSLVRVFDMKGGKGECLLLDFSSSNYSTGTTISISTDGTHLAHESRDGVVTVLDLNSGEERLGGVIIDRSEERLFSISTDGTCLACIYISIDRKMRVVNVNSGMHICPPLNIHIASEIELRFIEMSADRNYVMFVAANITLSILDLEASRYFPSTSNADGCVEMKFATSSIIERQAEDQDLEKRTSTKRNASDVGILLQRVTQNRDAETLFRLGLLFKNGSNSSKIDLLLPVTLYRVAIDHHFVPAYLHMALILMKGSKSSPQNKDRARYCYRKANYFQTTNSLKHSSAMSSIPNKKDSYDSFHNHYFI